jgi:hypothetical protein
VGGVANLCQAVLMPLDANAANFERAFSFVVFHVASSSVVVVCRLYASR